ncbi:piggyBac transposable element-derived protein 2-like isoform X2 [Sipha flava]|nr:piggyBac transposable element-derived protein 2-like isoform X2 [Sipha flava]
MNRNKLNDEELLQILFNTNWSDSEDGLDNSDHEQDLNNVQIPEHVDYPTNVNDEVSFDLLDLPVEMQFDTGETLILPSDSKSNLTYQNQNTTPRRSIRQAFSSPTESTSNTTNQSHSRPKEKNIELTNLKWKKGNLITPSACLKFNEPTLHNDLLSLETPLDFFAYFFNNELLIKIKEETELYSVQLNPNKPVTLSIDEIKRYLGICIYASVLHVPKIRDYWSVDLGFPLIYNTMSRNRFELIKSVLHFNNNATMLLPNNPNHDRLHKLRPIIDHLNNRFSSIPCKETLSLDEQLCATKAKSYMKQYLPDKPHKWGFKLFILTDTQGYAYRFEIYSGQENNPIFRKTTEPDFGASSNVVIRLTRNVPVNSNHKIYFDNYYTAIPMMEYLYNKNIYSLGTVRLNRLPNCPLPDKNQEKKMKRGDSIEYITSYKSAPISAVTWKDNKAVKLVSTYCGEIPKSEMTRFDRIKKSNIIIDCPMLIKEYNKHMGGVDLLDSHIGRYKIRFRSHKWYMRLFYHLIDLTVVNSWTLFKRVKEIKKENSNIELADWRKQLAFTLIQSGQIRTSGRGRPSSSLEVKIASTRPQSFRPIKEVRTDKFDHWPQITDKRERCKMPSCKGFTYLKCTKCTVFLCLNRNKNCFTNYHM